MGVFLRDPKLYLPKQIQGMDKTTQNFERLPRRPRFVSKTAPAVDQFRRQNLSATEVSNVGYNHSLKMYINLQIKLRNWVASFPT